MIRRMLNYFRMGAKPKVNSVPAIEGAEPKKIELWLKSNPPAGMIIEERWRVRLDCPPYWVIEDSDRYQEEAEKILNRLADLLNCLQDHSLLYIGVADHWLLTGFTIYFWGKGQQKVAEFSVEGLGFSVSVNRGLREKTLNKLQTSAPANSTAKQVIICNPLTHGWMDEFEIYAYEPPQA